MDILEREFRELQVLPGSSLDLELADAGLSRLGPRVDLK